MNAPAVTAAGVVAEMRRTLGFKKKGAFRLGGVTRRIICGGYTLNDLITLARDIKCSIPHLVTGCRAQYDGDLTPAQAVEASVRHAGWPMDEAASAAGYPDQRRFLKHLRDGTITVKALISVANAIGVTMEELFSDSECVMTRWEDCVPDDITYTREKLIMGWI